MNMSGDVKWRFGRNTGIICERGRPTFIADFYPGEDYSGK